MGQTLSHGVYLPNEGERNCYTGLASNWQILNTAVGAIAEKAPLVHTHTVSQITDFPAYGTTAGTICEGNDSRLSDARTPVAHTHSKADITDLFNSANVWTGNNIFPLSLYQKGFSPRASVPASNEFGHLSTTDTNNNAILSINYANRTTGARDLSLRVWDSTGNANGAGVYKDAIGNYSFCSINPNSPIDLGTSTNKWKSLNGINPGALSLPDTLGTSGTENVNYFNVIGYLNNTGTIASIPSTATYDGWLYINAKDGAGSYIIVDDYPSGFGTSVFGNNGLGSISVGLLCLICPIRAGHSYNVRIKSDGIVSARIYPAQGNV